MQTSSKPTMTLRVATLAAVSSGGQVFYTDNGQNDLNVCSVEITWVRVVL